MQSRENRCFQLPTTFRKLKGKGRTKKKQYTTNDAKLKGIVSYQVAFEKLLLLDDKHTGDWLIVRGNTVNDTVLAATQLSNFYEIVTIVSPPI